MPDMRRPKRFANRFELRVSDDMRRELTDLAGALDVDAAVLARFGIKWLLAHRAAVFNLELDP
jgi:hypothetical protein